jgi:hypothetical protein
MKTLTEEVRRLRRRIMYYRLFTVIAVIVLIAGFILALVLSAGLE